MGGKNGVGTGVRKTCAACRDESEPPFPESGGTIPKAYKPPATAPAIIRTSNSISRIEGPEYSGCLWAMAKDYKLQIVEQYPNQLPIKYPSQNGGNRRLLISSCASRHSLVPARIFALLNRECGNGRREQQRPCDCERNRV